MRSYFFWLFRKKTHVEFVESIQELSTTQQTSGGGQGSAGRDVLERDGPRPRRHGGRPRTRASGTRTRTGTRTSEDDILNFLTRRPRTRTFRTGTRTSEDDKQKKVGTRTFRTIIRMGTRTSDDDKQKKVGTRTSRTIIRTGTRTSEDDNFHWLKLGSSWNRIRLKFSIRLKLSFAQTASVLDAELGWNWEIFSNESDQKSQIKESDQKS